MDDLFLMKTNDKVIEKHPFAERMRPKSLQDVVGQSHLVGPNGILTRMMQTGSFGSMIFWGAPGTGKTTVARLLGYESGFIFEQISAVFSGVAELKKIFDVARQRRLHGKQTLVFVDEIHRFNRTQQDSFLPFMEDGTIILIGATTQNPSFELNSALLSRSRIFIFKSHEIDDLLLLMERAEILEAKQLPLDKEGRLVLAHMADGDARAILSFVEEVWRVTDQNVPLTVQQIEDILQRRAPLYDKKQDGHYNLISAFHKSVRGSDPDAALYYLARMLDAGEDPLYIGRRMVRIAVEDIALADPQALVIANAAKDAYEYLGSPEGELALAQACLYLTTAPKSNATYVAYKKALNSAKKYGSLMPPKHILNAPTQLMKSQSYGKNYRYDHDEPHAFSGQNYFPEKMSREVYYVPTERGFEREIRKRIAWWNKMRDQV